MLVLAFEANSDASLNCTFLRISSYCLASKLKVSSKYVLPYQSFQIIINMHLKSTWCHKLGHHISMKQVSTYVGTFDHRQSCNLIRCCVSPCILKIDTKMPPSLQNTITENESCAKSANSKTTTPCVPLKSKEKWETKNRTFF